MRSFSRFCFLSILWWPLSGLCQIPSQNLGAVDTVWDQGNASEGRIELERIAAASRRVEGGVPLAVVSFQAIDPATNKLTVKYELVPDNGLSLGDIRGVNSDDEIIDGAHSVLVGFPAPGTTQRDILATAPIRGDDGPFSSDVDFLRGDIGFTMPGTVSQFFGQLAIREPADQTALVGYLRAGPLRNELSTRIIEYSNQTVFGNVNQIDNGVGQITELDRDLIFSLIFKGVAEPAYVFVWTSFGSADDDNNLTSIQGRFADASGAAFGGQFQVNTITAGNQLGGRVAVAPNNDFVVVWTSDSSGDDDNSLTSIQARLFNANGTPKDVEFQVNQDIMGSQYQPDVAMADDGSFSVVWTDTPLTTSNVFIRDFAADGTPLTDQTQVNTQPGADSPRVAISGGSLVVAWRQGDNVARRGFFDRVFGSGFEDG